MGDKNAIDRIVEIINKYHTPLYPIFSAEGTRSKPIAATKDAMPLTKPVILEITVLEDKKASLSEKSTQTAELRMLLPPPNKSPTPNNIKTDDKPLNVSIANIESKGISKKLEHVITLALLPSMISDK